MGVCSWDTGKAPGWRRKKAEDLPSPDGEEHVWTTVTILEMKVASILEENLGFMALIRYLAPHPGCSIHSIHKPSGPLKAARIIARDRQSHPYHSPSPRNGDYDIPTHQPEPAPSNCLSKSAAQVSDKPYDFYIV